MTHSYPNLGEHVFSMSGVVKALSKERPRTGKAGHFFTPKRTRDYEKAIKEMAEVFVTEPPADFPVALKVVIAHKVPKSWPAWKRYAALKNWVSPSRGDLDNKVKAISDALNGIVFIDDVQICRLVAEMNYGSNEWVSVDVTRAGYSLEEARRLYDDTLGGGS